MLYEVITLFRYSIWDALTSESFDLTGRRSTLPGTGAKMERCDRDWVLGQRSDQIPPNLVLADRNNFV